MDKELIQEDIEEYITTMPPENLGGKTHYYVSLTTEQLNQIAIDKQIPLVNFSIKGYILQDLEYQRKIKWIQNNKKE